jgi:hypothetical protein
MDERKDQPVPASRSAPTLGILARNNKLGKVREEAEEYLQGRMVCVSVIFCRGLTR